MILDAARMAAADLLKPEFRTVLLKSIGLTLLLFIGAWIGLEALFSTYLAPFLGGWPILTTALVWLIGAGVFVGAGFLLAPVAAVFAGLFLDDAAEYVEKVHYEVDGPGKALPLAASVWMTLRFTVLVILANLAALLLVLLPGINFAIFFLLNGYLLGREYFMFAAMRFNSEDYANSLRKRYSNYIFMAGLIIAGFMAIPIINLATPVFAAAMMVHLHKSIFAEARRLDHARR